MPGGDKFRQWYAARKAMIERGTWRGKDAPTHKVPALDLQAGEPAPKIPRDGPLFGRISAATSDSSPNSEVAPSVANTVSDSNPDTPDSLPPLESPPTAEGKGNDYWFFPFILGT